MTTRVLVLLIYFLSTRPRSTQYVWDGGTTTQPQVQQYVAQLLLGFRLYQTIAIFTSYIRPTDTPVASSLTFCPTSGVLTFPRFVGLSA